MASLFAGLDPELLRTNTPDVIAGMMDTIRRHQVHLKGVVSTVVVSERPAAPLRAAGRWDAARLPRSCLPRPSLPRPPCFAPACLAALSPSPMPARLPCAPPIACPSHVSLWGASPRLTPAPPTCCPP